MDQRRRDELVAVPYFDGFLAGELEIDTVLLARMRARHPGKDDRSLIEDLGRIELGSCRDA